MAEIDRWVDLKPDRLLLDPNFDGYKLSLDSLPSYRVNLEYDLDDVKLTEQQYSYQHVKSFGLHNHLVLDAYNPDCAFFIDARWNVRKATVYMETQLDPPRTSFEIPDAANRRLTPERLNVTLSFPAAEWAVISDGAGMLYIINTGNRRQNDDWKVSWSGAVLGDNTCFTLLHSMCPRESDRSTFHCLLTHVEANPNTTEKAPPFVTLLDWVTISSDEQNTWTVLRKRQLESFSSPDYAAINANGGAIYIAAEQPFKFVSDSVIPVEEAQEVEEAVKNKELSGPSYTWMQEGEDVSVTFILPEGIQKADILYKLSTDHVTLGLRNGPVLLQGSLHGTVDVDSSTWTINERRLDLSLCRTMTEPWTEVVVGDRRGELVHTDAQAAAIHERLAHLTAEHWNAEPSEGVQSAFNSQQLEDCDISGFDAAIMQRFDGDTHQCTHQVNLSSHQWLFNADLDVGNPPAACLRHDVDGLIWQPTRPEDKAWKHVGTFNAFGYVQASKQQKKFTVCAPDMSFVAIADCVRHIYIYRQPIATLSPLRNRKTGREVSAIAKQQLVSLESVDHIMGVRASRERLFVIAGKTLYVTRINTVED